MAVSRPRERPSSGSRSGFASTGIREGRRRLSVIRDWLAAGDDRGSGLEPKGAECGRAGRSGVVTQDFKPCRRAFGGAAATQVEDASAGNDAGRAAPVRRRRRASAGRTWRGIEWRGPWPGRSRSRSRFGLLAGRSVGERHDGEIAPSVPVSTMTIKNAFIVCTFPCATGSAPLSVQRVPALCLATGTGWVWTANLQWARRLKLRPGIRCREAGERLSVAAVTVVSQDVV